MKEILDRLRQIMHIDQEYTWGRSVGWNKGAVERVFKQGQMPGTRELMSLAKIERVCLGWLLFGESAPYAVMPPPHWGDLRLGPDVSYYLFASNGGLQLPLVQICRQPMQLPIVQVYSGLPVDFSDVLDYLHRVRQPLYYAPDHPQVSELRKGWASNRVLLGDDENEGVLPEPDIYRDICEKLPYLALQEHNGSYLINPKAPEPAPERDWVWALRELDDEARQLVLALVKRLGEKKED